MSTPINILRREMSDLELGRARALSHCRFTPGTFDKRFAGEMGALAMEPAKGITEKQASRLEALCWTYRRQIPAELIPASKPVKCWK